MRVTYDPEADALYVYVADLAVSATDEVAPNVMLDRAADGALVGIEILDASHRPGANPMAMVFEILQRTMTKEVA